MREKHVREILYYVGMLLLIMGLSLGAFCVYNWAAAVNTKEEWAINYPPIIQLPYSITGAVTAAAILFFAAELIDKMGNWLQKDNTPVIEDEPE